MTETITILISLLALAVSVVTAWLTLFRTGTVRMTQPTLVFFGPDGPDGPPKVFLRTLLYSTSKRGRIVENMFVRLHRGESIQTFSIWVCGEGALGRGSGVYVGEGGITYNHHFLLPSDGTRYEFLPGDYTVDTHALLVGNRKPILLSRVRLTLTDSHAAAMSDKRAGAFFDWGPDSTKYIAHIDTHPKTLTIG